jgi:alkylation response protein AidB-like acyl-CoA dehydrogenase
MDMHQSGIRTRPIQLISGASPFCETFFDDAIARKEDLVGKLNQGWAVGKRLLQHERSGGLRVTARRPAEKRPKGDRMGNLGKKYLGEKDGKIADPGLRDDVLRHRMSQRALALTQSRAREENKSGRTPAEATSIFKLVGSTLTQNDSNLANRLMGFQGGGWEREHFESQEFEITRSWLGGRSHTIYGGTNEVQKNIIAKRMLGLPD